jgi:hypothetical protein
MSCNSFVRWQKMALWVLRRVGLCVGQNQMCHLCGWLLYFLFVRYFFHCRCLFRVSANVPRPCAVAVYVTLICPAKIKINAKRNAEFKNDNGNGARPLLQAALLSVEVLSCRFCTVLVRLGRHNLLQALACGAACGACKCV